MKNIKPVISSLIISAMVYGLFLYAGPVNNYNRTVTQASVPILMPNAATVAVTTSETITVTTSVTTTVSTTATVTTTPEQTTAVTTTITETTVTEPETEEAPVQGVINGEMLHDIEFTEYALPDNPYYRGFKSYEPYDLITAQSIQLCLQYQAVTDSNGFRLLDGRYLVAVGTFCNAPCGTYIDLILENGVLIPCIVGDIKADVHTDETNTFTVASMCASEFIVDDAISPVAWYGDVSMVYEEWNSKIHSVRVYHKNYY
ncbi:MAG: hypothetical protein PUE12_14180 [Oscillospiraceae bacterium]|nr:hypothetical protein [Oscillospiraceae bacterium]